MVIGFGIHLDLESVSFLDGEDTLSDQDRLIKFMDTISGGIAIDTQ